MSRDGELELEFCGFNCNVRNIICMRHAQGKKANVRGAVTMRGAWDKMWVSGEGGMDINIITII